MSWSGATIDKTQRRLWPFWLMPNITPLNAATYFTAAALGIPMLAFLSFVQPLALELAGVDPAIEGSVSGALTFYQEVIVLVITPFIGAAADKFGRRPLLMLGYAFLSLAWGVYAFADSIAMLFVYRSIFAFGIAFIATVIVIVSTDYVQEGSRGKWVAIASFTQGLGILALATLMRILPARLEAMGLETPEIARFIFWGAMGVCALALVLARFGLSPHKPPEARERDSFRQLIAAGLKAAREDARVALAYSTAFAARGDVIVVGTFLFIWSTRAAMDQGMSMGAGFARGGMLMGIVQMSALAWALVLTMFLDRFDRVTWVIIGFLLSAVGYLSFGLIGNPFNSIAIPAAVILGIGETSTIITGNALIGRTAPAEIRGAVLGTFGLAGACGILAASSLGGTLFDVWMPGGPYLQMGIINSCVLAFAIYVRFKPGAGVAESMRPQSQTTPAD